MESKYYSAKDIQEITGFSQNKSYDIIRKLNCEIKEITKNKPLEEQPLILNGRVLKSYFDKKMEV